MQVEFIDVMGSDLTVVNAARVSMDKESEWAVIEYGMEELNDKDRKLIRYLSNHNHFTPFTHCTITLRETVPIFVARQRFKHVVGFTYNEVSRRYVDDTPEFYTPDVWRKKAANVKQGSSDEPVNLEDYLSIGGDPVGVEEVKFTGLGSLKDEVERIHRKVAELYHNLINAGVAPEQARMVLPQSMYTSYYVTGSLYAFARAYKLRAYPHAQKEIRDVAEQWDKIIRPLYPESWSALVDKE